MLEKEMERGVKVRERRKENEEGSKMEEEVEKKGRRETIKTEK